MKIITKKIKVPAKMGMPAVEKEVIFLIGQGENCRCSDCPVLYGGECPFDGEDLISKHE
jgi:hypothetical protein